ncbi:MAG: zinc ribbon domain-containing protein [Candidatus Hodarchaeales archaeon]
MNSTSSQIRFQELSDHFTIDAWQLIDSFIGSLQKKMNKFCISSEEQVTVFDWIEEFIQEFVEDYKGKAKINFDEALGLIREIGSPSEILQAMELPIERIANGEVVISSPKTATPPAQSVAAPQQSVIAPQEFLKADERSYRLPCSACNWPNYPDAIFCENCGSKITEGVVARTGPTLLPGMQSHPTTFSIFYSYILLLIIGFFEAFLIYIGSLDEPNEADELLTGIIPAVFGVMMIPAVVFGLTMGYLVERLDQDQQPINLPSEIRAYPNAASILLAYGALLIIAVVEGILIYIAFIDEAEYQQENWLLSEWLGPAAIISILPAIIFGLIFSHLIQQVDQERRAVKAPRRMEAARGGFFPQEIIDYPFIGIFLLAYLILVIFGNFLYLIEGWGSFDIESFYEMPTEALVPAIISGIVGGLLISQLYRVSPRTKYPRQLTYFQKYYSLGIILTAISMWLFFIYVPIRISESQYTVISICLTVGSFMLPVWLYKWNLSNRPSDAPYWDLLRHKKVIESYNSKKLKDLNIFGGVIILVFVISAWSAQMTWTLLELPAWVAVAFSLILFLNGAALMSYYSWARINRFVGMAQS